MSNKHGPSIIQDPENNNDSGSYELAQTNKSTYEVSLSWKDVKFSFKNTQILKGVSGQANPKELLAIMGSSGCGKTSLLSILSDQLFPNNEIQISGTVQINTQSIKTLKYQSYCRYVNQQDILLSTLTPRESLYFAAKFKVEGTPFQINERVRKFLEKLNLVKAADNLVGSEMRKGLSGGEKKRLCIGMEMISDPVILILDEPTSGLDSHMAKMVIALLKEEAMNGKTVIMTIHQPGQDIFEMIDKLILMIAGHFIYQGPRSSALDYIQKLGFTCPPKTQAPDFFMRILHLKNRNSLTPEESETIEKLVSNYNSNEKTQDPLSPMLPYSLNEFEPGLLYSISLLVRRSFLNAKRNPLLFRVKIGQALVMGTILSLLFRDLGYGWRQVNNRVSLLFFLTVNTIMFGVLANCGSFTLERPMFLKDYKEGLYGVIAYYYSKFIAELPTVILFTLIYSLIVYFSCDLNRESAKHYFIFLGIQMLAHICGMTIGNFAGSIAPSFGIASFIGTSSSVPLLLFAGYLSNTNSLTVAFEWVKYISPFSRVFEGFVLNEFDGLDTDFSPVDRLDFTGEVWHKVGNLILIILGSMIMALSALKIKAERSKLR
jgi:ATP-binding cassette subfamily G (WHITE) protein 1